MSHPHAPHPWNRRELLGAAFSAGVLATLAPRAALAGPLLRVRDPEADRILNQALQGPGWWDGASVDRFENKLYDEIRLKKLGDGGYLTYVSGEGGEDFAQEDVARTVWDHQDKLDNHFHSTIAAITLGKGQDGKLGREYRDRYMLLDFGLFYGRQIQRMYRYDLPDGRTVLPFERLTSGFTDAGTWQKYLSLRDQQEQGAREKDRLRSVFDSFVDIDLLYGMFIMEPGKARTTRVSLIAKIGFTSDNSWVASVGSKIPSVIRSGLRGGFDGSVAVCRAVKSGQYD